MSNRFQSCFPAFRGGFAVALFLIASATAAWAQTPAGLAAERALFISAERALARGDLALYRGLRAQLDGYSLAPYLDAADLEKRLRSHPASEIRELLDRYPDVPPVRRLRQQWLRYLAERQAWDTLRRDYAYTGVAELECQYRRALMETGDAGAALEGLEKLWLTGRSLPDACDPLLDRWRKSGGLTTELVRQRLRLAVEAGQPGMVRYLAGLLPEAERPWGQRWLAVTEDYRVVVTTPDRFPRGAEDTTEKLLHAISTWSRRNSLEASEALDRVLRRHTIPADRLGPLQARLAVLLAARGEPVAATRLAAVPVQYRDDAVWEWGVRLNLRSGDWHGVLAWLQDMPAPLDARAPWRYWRARALEATGRGESALALYRELAGLRDYYGFLAAARVNEPFRMNPDPVRPDAAAVDRLAATAPARRARELLVLDRPWDARTEWQIMVGDLDPSDLVAAAELARRWHWHDRAIVALAGARLWDDLEIRFPTPHRDLVVDASRRHDLPPEWVFAVMRQESLFQRDARSGAGAIGLMQLLPGTAQQMARTLGEPFGGNHTLVDPQVNIRYGTRYLRHTLDRLQGHPMLAAAAYNAGPARVAAWLPPRTLDADVWAELIPFAETRDYVKRVTEYSVVYAHQLGTTPAFDRMTAPVRPGG